MNSKYEFTHSQYKWLNTYQSSYHTWLGMYIDFYTCYPNDNKIPLKTFEKKVQKLFNCNIAERAKENRWLHQQVLLKVVRSIQDPAISIVKLTSLYNNALGTYYTEKEVRRQYEMLNEHTALPKLLNRDDDTFFKWCKTLPLYYNVEYGNDTWIKVNRKHNTWILQKDYIWSKAFPEDKTKGVIVILNGNHKDTTDIYNLCKISSEVCKIITDNDWWYKDDVSLMKEIICKVQNFLGYKVNNIWA